jgi:hypothetical protein
MWLGTPGGPGPRGPGLRGAWGSINDRPLAFATENQLIVSFAMGFVKATAPNAGSAKRNRLVIVGIWLQGNAEAICQPVGVSIIGHYLVRREDGRIVQARSAHGRQVSRRHRPRLDRQLVRVR